MAKLEIGTVLKTTKLKTVKVLSQLGEGGQGTVYLVDYDGQEKALKWYHENACRGNKKEFIENLKENVEKGSPSSAFLWPEDVTEVSHNSVGYIMELRPKDYVVLSKFLLKQKFASFQTCVDAMINIVNAFRMLHNKGYSYQDINDGNFFINPNNGKVLICDNDNVAPFGYNMGVKGKSRYMAPEVVLSKTEPNKASDRFSMAVLLFMLLCKAHPLEGHNTNPACLKKDFERKIYGESPLFIFDPIDNRNRPIKGVHNNAIVMWPELPDYIKEAFVNSFSQKALKNPGARLIEREWLDVLLRFRNSIVKCSKCGNEEFVNNENYICSCCNQSLGVMNSIILPHYTIPAVPGVTLYRQQFGNCSDEEALNKVLQIIQSKKDPNNIGLGNAGNKTWLCENSSGQKKSVAHKEILPLRSGYKIYVYGVEIKIN